MSNGGNSQTEDFTGLDGNWWENRTSGINWTFHPQRNGGAGDEQGLIMNNRFRPRVTDYWYYSDFIPASPDYDVEMDVVLLSQEPFNRAGVVGRMDTSEVTGYEAWMDLSPESETIELRKWVNGSMTVLDSATPEPWVDNDVRRIKLEMRGTSIRMLVNGIEVCSAVDSDIVAIGRAGFTQDCAAGSTTHVHYDNWTVRDAGFTPPSLDPITDLVAVAGDGTVTLSWTPPAGATSQQLHRSTSPGVPQDGSAAIGPVLSGSASQTTDDSVQNDTTYYYRISATDGEATVWSNEVSATPGDAVDISGTVTFDNGSPAEGVTIYVINQATGEVVATTQTAADGTYSFNALPAGTYHVSPRLSGFMGHARSDVEVA